MRDRCCEKGLDDFGLEEEDLYVLRREVGL
jgi:hypothetical protein